jgi:WD40 repeat protein
MLPTVPFKGHRGPVYALIAGDAPRTFLSGSGDGLVVRWDLDRPDEGRPIAKVEQAVFSLLRTGPLLLIGTEGGDLHVVDHAQGRELHRFTVHRRGLFRMMVLDDQRVVCAGGDGSLSIWQWSMKDAPVFRLLRQIPLVEEKLRDLAVDPSGRLLAVACGDGSVRVLDTALFNEHQTLNAHPGDAEVPAGTTSVAFHPSKPVLLSGGKDGHLRVWDLANYARLLLALPAHKGSIYRMAFGPGGTKLATASRDKSAKVWDALSLDPVQRLDRLHGGHTHSVNDVLWTGLDTLVTAGDDRMVFAWSV